MGLPLHEPRSNGGSWDVTPSWPGNSSYAHSQPCQPGLCRDDCRSAAGSRIGWPQRRCALASGV